ncbi:transcriptional regulator [Levilactobacillus paucivorans]|uniref:Transcriptional regulator n=1 Tax=Levilactobacillus paucivorans TaxID=616990 RepID=A0A0R2LU57_9LACO|nr:TetR/AcrR family transcriptional regulator [Levilactobacillus paucivorans]KRO03756.1 transcriptional regulator [Levilactobacillus paucivorans]
MAERPYHRENLAATIAQQARIQLEANGAEQLSLRQIARFLDVTPAAVYRHYPDKASLLTQLRVTITDELTATLREGVLDSADATVMLTRMVTNLLAYAAQHPQAIAFVLTTPLAVPQSLQTVVTLYTAQHPAMTATQNPAQACWLFLLGILLVHDQTLTAAWITTQLTHLLGN